MISSTLEARIGHFVCSIQLPSLPEIEWHLADAELK